MTFKHIDFDDSPTMRSLLKVAHEKGLIKQEEKPLVKTASKELDLSPSESLTENIVKLCAGLRSKGFDKYADQLEEKFLSFKAAEAKDEGEKLLDEAHPEGSVEVADAEDDLGVVEDAIEQHSKIREIAEKVASSKKSLNANKKIVNQVLLALGTSDDLTAVKKAYDLISHAVYGPYNTYKQNDFKGYQLVKTDDEDDEAGATFELLQAFKNAEIISKLNTSFNFLKPILSKSAYDADDITAIVNSIDSIIFNCILPAYKIFMMPVFDKKSKNIYSASNLDIKKAGYAWWQALKNAQGTLESVRKQYGGDKPQVSGTPQGYADSDVFAQAINNSTAQISTLKFDDDGLIDDRAKVLKDLSNLKYFFTKGYLSETAESNGETKDGKINLSKLPSIISNLAFSSIRDDAAGLGVNLSTVTSLSAFQLLLSKFVEYFKHYASK